MTEGQIVQILNGNDWLPFLAVFLALSQQCRCDEIILLPTKPIWLSHATVLKPLPGTRSGNNAPQRRTWALKTVKQGTTMFDLDVSNQFPPAQSPSVRSLVWSFLRIGGGRTAAVVSLR